MSYAAPVVLAAAALAGLAACSGEHADRTPATQADSQPPSATAGASASGDSSFVVRLSPLNDCVSGCCGGGVVGVWLGGVWVWFATQATGLPKDITHWQHFHGFKDGKNATCPTATADKNGDGIVDLIETEPTSGTTMVPFIEDPVSMDVAKGTYPKASADGALDYRKTVSASALEAAFGKAFPGQKLELDKRVVFIHGVPESTKLPKSVASLGPLPANVTIPIACGKIERQ
jgi:hypothetical protein